jgi:hypothetical protein
MNCDKVFDVLTRGPFPTGTACDAPVEAHLQVCPECRRLAEALRPALELFQEAIGPEESRDLPGYWCAVGTERTGPLVSYARELEQSRVSPRPVTPAPAASGFSALSAWGLAASLALGVLLGMLASARWTYDGFSAFPSDQSHGVIIRPADEDETRFTPVEKKLLAGLPAACYRNQPAVALRNTAGPQRVLDTADLGNLACCTQCHNAASDTVSSHATMNVSQSCQICHKEKLAAAIE